MISLKDTRELIIHCHEVGIHGTNLFDVFNTNIDKKSFVGNLNHYRTKKKKNFMCKKSKSNTLRVTARDLDWLICTVTRYIFLCPL